MKEGGRHKDIHVHVTCILTDTHSTFVEISKCIFSHSLGNGDGGTQGNHVSGGIKYITDCVYTCMYIRTCTCACTLYILY